MKELYQTLRHAQERLLFGPAPAPTEADRWLDAVVEGLLACGLTLPGCNITKTPFSDREDLEPVILSEGIEIALRAIRQKMEAEARGQAPLLLCTPTGQVVYTAQPSPDGTTMLDLAPYPPGLYFLRQGQVTIKVVRN